MYKDPFVYGLAKRYLEAYEELATALEHQADGWANNDKATIHNGIQEEMNAMAKQSAISKEWLNDCRQ
jgi:hypothetical protein